MNCSSNLYVDKIKSIIAYRTYVLVTVLKDDLPNSKVYVNNTEAATKRCS